MFIPKRIIFEKGSLDYDIGKNILDFFKDNKDVEIIKLTSNRVKNNIPGDNLHDFYREGKKTLVVGVKKGFKFQSCKPSAHYQLPLVSGCIGQCEYCYLNTNLGHKPYIKVNANIDDILNKANDYIKERGEKITIFEGAATSDPVPIEPYSNMLKNAIGFFGKTPNGRFRFVTKYGDIDSLLNINHSGHTEMRFTLNTDKVKSTYENKTASIDNRIDASVKAIEAGYPVGYLIAPVFMYEGWEKEYKALLESLKSKLPKNIKYPITFEIISHRYTSRAKGVIEQVFPESKLPMNDEERTYKYGQFGYGKFVYKKESLQYMKEFFNKEIESMFENKIIKYII